MYTNVTENVQCVFNHKCIRKYTWEQHTKNLKTFIDYIITKQDLKPKIQDVRSYRRTNCGTDRKLISSHNFVSLYVHNQRKTLSKILLTNHPVQ